MARIRKAPRKRSGESCWCRIASAVIVVLQFVGTLLHLIFPRK